MTDAKITDLDAAASLGGSEDVEVVQSGVNVRTTAQAIADLAPLPTELPPNGPAGGSLDGDYPNPSIAAGAVGTTELADDAVTNAKMADNAVGTSELIDASVTIAKLSAALLAILAGAPPVVDNETDTPSGASYTIGVDAGTHGVILIGGSAGKYGSYDWTTRTWTEGTFSGASAITYTWATYVTSSDLILAGSATVTHKIDPNTHVATDITATTGALITADYNAVADKVYGFIASSSTIKEIAPSLASVARTFVYATASSGYKGVGHNPVTGMLYVQMANTGSGARLLEIPYSAFNAVARTGTLSGNAMTAKDRIIIDPVGEHALIPRVGLGAEYYDLSGVSLTGLGVQRGSGSTGSAVYHATTERIYEAFYTSIPGGGFISRIDPATDDASSEAVTRAVSATTGQTITFLISCSDGMLYAVTTTGTMIRIRP